MLIDTGGGGSAPKPKPKPKPSSGGGGSNGWSKLGTAAVSYGGSQVSSSNSYSAPAPSASSIIKQITSGSSPVKVAPTPRPDPVARPEDDSITSLFNLPKPDLGIDLGSPQDFIDEREALQRVEDAAKPENKPKERKAFEMTKEAYQALTDRQRSAVDFNTMLVEARNKDLRSDYEPKAAEEQTYNEAVKRMFGEDGGSDIYAPETVAVLNQIDFKGTEARKGDDLDDFLGLRAALSAKDIGTLDLKPRRPMLPRTVEEFVAPEVNDTRTELAQALVAQTSNLEQKLAESGKMLQDFRTTAKFGRNEEAAYLGGTPNDVKVPLGFGEGEADQFFQGAYEALAKKSPDDKAQLAGDVQQLMSVLDQQGMREAFVNYVDTRTAQARDYGTPLVDTKGGVRVRTPDEYREIFGLSERAE